MRAKNITIATLAFLIAGSAAGQSAAKLVSDCTVIFDINVSQSKGSGDPANVMQGATKTLYLKGNRSRTDLQTANFKQTIITNSKSDTVVVLREIGSSRYLSYLSGEKKMERVQKYEGMTLTNTKETKNILGYTCNKVIATLKDNTTFNIFFAPSIKPSNTDFEYELRDVPGFVLEYESETEDKKTRITYTAKQITLLPVPAVRFDIPTEGYRIL